MKTVTRSDIAESICEQIGLSRKDAGEILDMVIEEIRRCKNCKIWFFLIKAQKRSYWSQP